MTPIRRCADCKWMRDPGPLAKCVSPRNESPLGARLGFDNHRERILVFCSSHRMAGPYGCGENGKWFEPTMTVVEGSHEFRPKKPAGLLGWLR